MGLPSSSRADRTFGDRGSRLAALSRRAMNRDGSRRLRERHCPLRQNRVWRVATGFRRGIGGTTLPARIRRQSWSRSDGVNFRHPLGVSLAKSGGERSDVAPVMAPCGLWTGWLWWSPIARTDPRNRCTSNCEAVPAAAEHIASAYYADSAEKAPESTVPCSRSFLADSPWLIYGRRSSRCQRK